MLKQSRKGKKKSTAVLELEGYYVVSPPSSCKVKRVLRKFKGSKSDLEWHPV